jgi:hypothetical protein
MDELVDGASLTQIAKEEGKGRGSKGKQATTQLVWLSLAFWSCAFGLLWCF